MAASSSEATVGTDIDQTHADQHSISENRKTDESVYLICSELDRKYLVEHLATSPLRKLDCARVTFLYSRCLLIIGRA